ncbi:MAG: hypothetical protein UR96_C0010G0007 [candidate division WS6 bacterium GW2011_GWC1_36_11]|uniref:Uncharacterized protein n=2 Tax=Candidatus Dojkabacteria TaxID=74243 RepID=A0A0G0DE27_9BACT|nr:MAG: hypothetical protein UR96_C0010G0007 [candidate division WS6 bacterium GW2011_GWC1_36_11]KKQ04662.1 MAG: hypothetical protein US14_C0003G0025 [candidate division WS6 bacterium GW2011_WS6_36_26]KKQ16963.1 MAG: hypothetical protein US29_C0015G0007 [candidate division WS6 bacterium GW2011_GWF1_36_8]HAM96291.1 hypothetical protein [Patescibacteria group bacterium]
MAQIREILDNELFANFLNYSLATRNYEENDEMIQFELVDYSMDIVPEGAAFQEPSLFLLSKQDEQLRKEVVSVILKVINTPKTIFVNNEQIN